MISKQLVFFSLLLCSFFPQGEAQTPVHFVVEQRIPGFFSEVAVDQLNFIYLITRGGQLKKYNIRGDSMGMFNEVRRLGQLTAIDVSNPMKTLLFYQHFNTGVVLDRFLGRRNTLDLRQANLLQVKAISQAFDNGYWVYDEQESRIKHLDEKGSITDQFADFRLLFDSLPSPQKIIDQNKNLYLYDPEKGVYIFDYYGSFRKRLPYKGWKDFTVIHPYMLGHDNQFLYRVNLQTLEQESYPLISAFAEASKILVTSTFVYVLKIDQLEVYRFHP
jgi:hypothetical protein